jgi:hypothetical protein
MVTTFPAQLYVNPAGKPVTVAPVAIVVAYVIFVRDVLIHRVCASVPALDVSKRELFGLTVMEPVAVTMLQPPVKVTV